MRGDLCPGQRRSFLDGEVGRENCGAGRSVDAECHAIRDTRHCGDLGVDLAELDAESANLDLEVAAPDVFDGVIASPGDDVARAVHPVAWLAEGVGDKSLAGQAGTPVVSASQADAGDVQLTGSSDGYGLQARIEDHLVHAADRSTDRDGCAHCHGFADVCHDGCLGRAVGVDEFSSGSPEADEMRR